MTEINNRIANKTYFGRKMKHIHSVSVIKILRARTTREKCGCVYMLVRLSELIPLRTMLVLVWTATYRLEIHHFIVTLCNLSQTKCDSRMLIFSGRITRSKKLFIDF